MKRQWLLLGECPSHLLYSKIRKQRVRNDVTTLQDVQGNWTSCPAQIMLIVQDFWTSIFSNTSNSTSEAETDRVLEDLQLPTLTAQQQASLIHAFSADEIKEAMFSIAGSKSPGPDGFTAEFYKTHWDLIGPDIIAVIQSFFQRGFLLQAWNNTLLVMLPKVPNPTEVSQLRPISLCNTIYKCISKCLVNRMKPLLPLLVSQYQHAFVPGRSMTDNVLLSHELLHFINRKKTAAHSYATVKIDLNKAYDRIHWTFLRKTLKAYGFPELWVHWIIQCVSSVSFKILLNGQLSKPIYPKCGLRQGDPLSPYLFILCMDIYSRMLSSEESLHYLKGIKVSRRSPAITHLFFADDALLLFQTSSPACEYLSSLNSRFCVISGYKINFSKSYIKFSPNTSMIDKTSFKDLLFMNHKDTMASHLGVPLDTQHSKSSHFHFLIDVIAQRLLSWNSLLLSMPTKVILINTVIVSMVAHILSSFSIPISIAHRLDAMVMTFLWSNKEKSGIHWVKKEQVHLPKGFGGLGIRSFNILNKVYLMRMSGICIPNRQACCPNVFKQLNLLPSAMERL